MKHDNPDSQNYSGPHPGDAELIDYLGGRLAEPSGDEVQAHLVVCDQCLELFRDMRNFFDSQRPGEQMIGEDIATEWRGFWSRIKEEPQIHQSDYIPQQAVAGFRFNSASSFAVAALLLVVFALGFWALSQRRQKQQLAERLESAEKQTAQLQAEHENLADRFEQSELEKLELQERARKAAEPRGTEPVGTQKAELNVPIYDLYARDFNRRSGNESDLNRIKVPATARSIVLILNGEGVPTSPGYGIEIVSDKGRAIWRGKGLKKGHMGSLTITVDRRLIANGTYRLRLYGQDGQSSNALAEYLVRIE